MGKGVGIFCILLGILCLMASACFVLYNQNEANDGAVYSEALLQDVQSEMAAQAPSEPDAPMAKAAPQEMLTVPAGKYESIGILSIPALELELPVLTDWSYEKLKKAPCHYYGSCYEPDFVIAAHNFPSHFGRLNQLQAGDLVLFTDVTGQVHSYEVVLLETLSPTATEAMITSGFDLSLYTCTPGGGSRVTVRCKTIHK